MPSSSLPPAAAEVVPRLDIRDPDLWLRALAWAVIVGSALLILTFSFGRDQGIYAVVGQGLLDGKTPYKDLWDFKPPGIFFIYALAHGVFGSDMMAPRMLEVLALLGSVACVRRLSGVWFENRTVGLVAGALIALIQAQMDFWHTGQPETFAAFFTLLGLMLTSEEPRRYRIAVCLAVGAAFGCAALLKPPLGGGALVCAAYLTKRERTRGKSLVRSLSVVGWVALGGALTLLLCLVWFWARGALGDLYWTLGEFAPGYTSLSWEGRRAADMLYSAIEQAFFGYSALLAAGVIALIGISPLFLREREALFLVLGVIAIHVAGIAMQGKFFAYHYGATLPLVALLSAMGLYKLWRRCLAGGIGGAIAFLSFVAVATPMRYPVRDLPQYFWERSWLRLHFLLQVPPYDSRERLDKELAYVADYNLAVDAEVALRVRARTGSDQKIFIWGFEPVIYWLSGREPASRFIYNVPQRSPWQREYAREELMRDLARNRPAVVIVQRNDVFPQVTGRWSDSKSELADFPELSRLLSREFSYRQSLEDFEIYARRAEPLADDEPDALR